MTAHMAGYRPISIHALLVEGDTRVINVSVSDVISIHALYKKGDKRESQFITTTRNFNPRPPCGERR